MLLDKKPDIKEIQCRVCHKNVKPIIKRNTLKNNFFGQRYSGLEKKYVIICPNCKAVIVSKN